MFSHFSAFELGSADLPRGDVGVSSFIVTFRGIPPLRLKVNKEGLVNIECPICGDYYNWRKDVRNCLSSLHAHVAGNHPATKEGKVILRAFPPMKVWGPEIRAKFSKALKKAYADPGSKAAKYRIFLLSEANRGKNSNLWKGGISFRPYCPKFNQSRREEVRNQYSRTCIISGVSDLQNGQRLHIDHIDENKMQGCNGIPWRLIPLSHSVHSRMILSQNHLLLQLLLYGNSGAQMNYMFPEESVPLSLDS